jgi:hypothetical protein
LRAGPWGLPNGFRAIFQQIATLGGQNQGATASICIAVRSGRCVGSTAMFLLWACSYRCDVTTSIDQQIARELGVRDDLDVL